MRYYIYVIHTDGTRNRLHDVCNDPDEAAAIERELQSLARPEDPYFVRMFPAHNLDEARARADGMRSYPKVREICPDGNHSGEQQSVHGERRHL